MALSKNEERRGATRWQVLQGTAGTDLALAVGSNSSLPMRRRKE